MTIKGAKFVCVEFAVEIGAGFVQLIVRHKFAASSLCGLAESAFFLQHFIGHESFFTLESANDVPENTPPRRINTKNKDLSRLAII